MGSKNFTDVIIAGKVYTLGGYEEEDYLQRVAAYLNGKYEELQKVEGFVKQSPEDQAVLLELNVADDYFRVEKQLDESEKKNLDMEREVYNLKHALVTTQLKKENLEKELIRAQERIQELEKRPDRSGGDR
ncbi:MAG: cell division protein ZapA [Lachnospiraceae bacterium]|nr:cell division protein ZapA [Lachnospiraceae bacterium]